MLACSVGGDPGAVVQDLLEVLLVADPFGHLAEHDELARPSGPRCR